MTDLKKRLETLAILTYLGDIHTDAESARYGLAGLAEWAKHDFVEAAAPLQFELNLFSLQGALVTGDDGRAVLEMMYAAYKSAGSGQTVNLPFSAKVTKPIDLWLGA